MDNLSYAYSLDRHRHRRKNHHSGRLRLEEEMERVRRYLQPGAFSAPLNQGELTAVDKLKLLFLIGFPIVCFLLGIVITSEVPKD
ncbi:hypothetical protein ElyMa_003389200 [Elysia marginata]|uniref:Uncharacterized protein n=1 Tax=Elysia marginata TaxID=1093978 RepID=A0AAV4JS69_9GAST|nr:hypothetical protein ElyMa_003389200 [Elysia marginata]